MGESGHQDILFVFVFVLLLIYSWTFLGSELLQWRRRGWVGSDSGSGGTGWGGGDRVEE